MSSKKILMSGVKPTGAPHVGNYFGAMKQWLDMQKSYDSYFMIADYHALNLVQNAAELRELILNLAIDYLAIGLNPEECVIFQQSAVRAHTELAWIFDTITTMPYLMRAHAFKDAEAKSKDIVVGTFNYPMLMAADILLYSPDVVPVGQDQKQHVEITRDTALKFNNTFGETFKLPEAVILKDAAVVPGLDGQKMSKSYKNTIPLFASDEEIRKAVMSIPTDSRTPADPKDPSTDKIFALHKLFASADELATIKEGYEKGGMSYKESKEMLVKNVSAFIAPFRERRAKIAADLPRVLQILAEGAKKASERAERKMEEVRKAVGVIL